MEKFDINKLREETLKAIREGEDFETTKKIQDLEKETLRDKSARLWAEQKVLNVPALAMQAARKGKNKIKIADTKKHYYATIQHSNDFYGGWDLKTEGLRYKYLQDLSTEMGLAVTVSFQHDGIGIESWYDVHASW